MLTIKASKGIAVAICVVIACIVCTTAFFFKQVGLISQPLFMIAIFGGLLLSIGIYKTFGHEMIVASREMVQLKNGKRVVEQVRLADVQFITLEKRMVNQHVSYEYTFYTNNGQKLSFSKHAYRQPHIEQLLKYCQSVNQNIQFKNKELHP